MPEVGRTFPGRSQSVDGRRTITCVRYAVATFAILGLWRRTPICSMHVYAAHGPTLWCILCTHYLVVKWFTVPSICREAAFQHWEQEDGKICQIYGLMCTSDTYRSSSPSNPVVGDRRRPRLELGLVVSQKLISQSRLCVCFGEIYEQKIVCNRPFDCFCLVL